MSGSASATRDFILADTRLCSPPLAPERRLLLADQRRDAINSLRIAFAADESVRAGEVVRL